MTRPSGLCWGTLSHAGLPELIEAAAGSGFDWISVSPQQYAEAGCADAELRQRLDDAGLVVREVDPLLTWLPGLNPVPGAGLLAYGIDDVLRSAEALNAPSINAAVAFAGDWTLPQITDSFAAVCERGAASGLGVTLEFLPWSRVRDLPSAVEVVRSCDATNAGVTFDVWHFHRGGGVVGELSDDDLVYLRGVQLSDALAEPVGDPMAESISQRLMPGEGVIPFDTLIPRLVAAAPTATIGVEVFNTTYADRPTADVAREAMRTARAVFG